jgi:hypothetical protein
MALLGVSAAGLRRAGVVPGPVSFIDWTYYSGISGDADLADATEVLLPGDLALALFGRNSSISAFGAPVIDLGNGSGACRAGYFEVSTGLETFPVQSGSHGGWFVFRDAAIPSAAAFNSGSSQTFEYPSVTVDEDGSVVICFGYRAAVGGVGAVTPDAELAEELFHTTGNRVAAYMTEPVSAGTWSGANCGFAASSATWATCSVVLPPS